MAVIWNTISNNFWPADLAGKKIEYSILLGSRVITVMMCVYLSSAFLSAGDYMAIHLVFGRRILPLESTFPFPWDVSPTFELITVWQFILHMYTIIHTIATHDFFFNSLVSCCNGQFRLIQGTLKTIGSPTGRSISINRRLNRLFGSALKDDLRTFRSKDEEEFDLVSKCIEHHNRVIQYGINDLWLSSN